MADPTLSELTERAETAKAITDPNARRVAIEEHLGLAHEGLDELLQTLGELNETFRDEGERPELHDRQ